MDTINRKATKIGVITPTYNRPDCIRGLVLQMENQSLKPDVLAIHQNGNKDSYRWAIDDIGTDIDIQWIHTPYVIPQDEWYLVPLRKLIEQGCTHFFWCDHDDFYYRDHVANGVRALDAGGYDHVVNQFCDLILLKQSGVQFHRNIRFTSHAPGGMSSSMCFNRAFAMELEKDLAANQGQRPWSDNVVKHVTMPKFKCLEARGVTTGYCAHAGTYSSSQWVA